MRVLVTGATGYLGSHVASALCEGGHEVLVLRRPASPGKTPAGCRPIPGDLRDPASLTRALGGCDALVHLAAKVETWARDPREFDRVNVAGTEALLRAAEEAGVRRILYTSTIVALGPTDGAVADESSRRATLRFHTDYERTKWIALNLVRRRVAEGLPAIVVYPGVVFGPGAPTQGNLLRKTLIDQDSGRLRARLGRGDRRICYAYVGDVARGHRLALEKGTAGRDYILGGENATQDEVFSILRELTGHAPPRLAIPYWIGEALGRLLILLARVTKVPPAVTPGVVATYRHEWAYDCGRARRELGYETITLREGLRRTLEALRAEAEGPRGVAPRGAAAGEGA